MGLLTNRFFLTIFPLIFKTLSPILISQMQPLLDQLKDTAKSTPNPWDDILVWILEELLKGFISDNGGG